MKRVIKYLLVLLVLSVSYPVYSQSRNVIVNTGAQDRSEVITNTNSSNTSTDIWAQLEQEQIAAEKAEQERIAAEKAEQERIAAEKKAEQERIAAEKADYVQNAKMKTLIMGQVGYSFAPQLSYGAMIGQMYKGIGWYISGRSNFNFAPSASVVCDANGMVDGEMPFYSGDTKITHYIATGGLMINFLEWSATNKFNTFGLHLGAGYGSREKQWQTTGGQWIKYGPNSYSGVAVNAGIFGSIAGFTLKAGASTIAFKYLEIEAGIGFMF